MEAFGGCGILGRSYPPLRRALGHKIQKTLIIKSNYFWNRFKWDCGIVGNTDMQDVQAVDTQTRQGSMDVMG